MSPLEILLDNEEMADLSDLTTAQIESLVAACPTAAHAFVIAFIMLVSAAKLSETDAGTEFERLLALYEKRVRATHRGSGALN